MSDALPTLLAALHVDPGDATAWLALADALEERGEPLRAELLRLGRSLLGSATIDENRLQRERRLRTLLADGVEPCVPVLTNSIGMDLALIPAGTFLMGSPEEEANRFPDEGPRREVRIGRPYYLGIFPVTQGQYEAVMGRNPSWFSPGNRASALADVDHRRLPVERVAWAE